MANGSYLPSRSFIDDHSFDNEVLRLQDQLETAQKHPISMEEIQVSALNIAQIVKTADAALQADIKLGALTQTEITARQAEILALKEISKSWDQLLFDALIEQERVLDNMPAEVTGRHLQQNRHELLHLAFN